MKINVIRRRTGNFALVFLFLLGFGRIRFVKIVPLQFGVCSRRSYCLENVRWQKWKYDEIGREGEIDTQREEGEEQKTLRKYTDVVFHYFNEG